MRILRLDEVVFTSSQHNKIKLVSTEDWVVNLYVNDEDHGLVILPHSKRFGSLSYEQKVGAWASLIWFRLVDLGVACEEDRKDYKFLREVLSMVG